MGVWVGLDGRVLVSGRPSRRPTAARAGWHSGGNGGTVFWACCRPGKDSRACRGGRGDGRAPSISLGLTGPLFPSRQPCPRHASQPSHPFSWWPTGPGSRLEVHLSIHETAPAEQWHGTPPGFFGERTNESFFLQAIRIPRGTAIGRTVVCLVRTGKASQTVLPSVRPSTPSLWPITGGNSVLAETKWVWGGRRIRWPRFWLPIRDSIARRGIPPTFSCETLR